MMKLIRYLLFPVVPFYFIVTWLRNKFFDWGLFESKAYQIPIVCVGNLSVGGTGKTPMIEYLIRLLKNEFRLATLSRGYKRTTEGFVMADAYATASSIGDEPYQFHTKFDDIIVSVDANRQRGIAQLMQATVPPEVLLLDDAYQHRKVKAGFNILLTSYHDLYVDDILLPTGNLREPKSGAKRAHLIVVTKCPKTISELEKESIVERLAPTKRQHVFFSWIDYSEIIKNNDQEIMVTSLRNKHFTLVTGIANAAPLVSYLQSQNLQFEHLNFPDHHDFTDREISMLKEKEWILTTEKDYMRLTTRLQDHSSLYYLPITLAIDRAAEFNQLVKLGIK